MVMPPSTKAQRADAAVEAFLAYRALLQAEIADPSLKGNPFWQGLRADVYADFTELYRRIG